MPGGNNNRFTFAVGPVRFIGISTEVYYKKSNGSLEKVYDQLIWLEKVLRKANEKKNRKKHPWIILLGHRPLYCAAIKSDCQNETTKVAAKLEIQTIKKVN